MLCDAGRRPIVAPVYTLDPQRPPQIEPPALAEEPEQVTVVHQAIE
jgi:hypothetical protein